ncbi:hypothetical protein HGB07_05495 [Candidatus Roizmanbacteria bacterium]|nr:hypothetical protein [Candidatus Roizmanbacteria bacterium]
MELKRSIIIVLLFILVAFPFVVHSQEQDESQKKQLQDRISQYQQKLGELGQTHKTLSSQILYMDTQMDLTVLKMQETEAKIQTTQKEIGVLTERIDGLDTSLGYLSKLLVTRVVDGYKKQSITIFDVILNAENAAELLSQLKYFKTAQDNNQKLLVQVQEAKLNFEEQKKLRETKKVQLDNLNATLAEQKLSLEAQKAQKQKLLAETQNDESTYQRLLSEAQSQLAAFGKFVASQGGSGLLSGQTSCDSWGCYYNQRDSQWGATPLNGTGYTLADSGCLITSMAMIYSHFGHRNVTPQTINSIPSNFASYYPAWLNFTIIADGATASRVRISSIDSELSSGRPVVAGISYDGGPLPDHYIVLTSGSGGNYTMNDPYTSGGHNIPLTSHYSVNSIVAVYKVDL